MKYCLLFLFLVFKCSVNAQSDFLWAKSIKGTSSEDGSTAEMGSMTVDAWGNVYLTGFFTGTVDFDPGAGIYNLTVSSSYGDIFILKLDASGNFLWAKNMGGASADWGHSIAVDPAGNVYTTGLFYWTADFDPGAGTFNLTSNGSSDIFISKLDSSGNFVWAKSMGGTASDERPSIALDAAGNIYTTGNFAGTVDFDPGAGTFVISPASGYNYDVFVSKLDSSGNFVWAKNMGGPSFDIAYSIAIDASGNVYTTGYFYETADFDPGAGTFYMTSDSSDVFISKLDSAGNFIWAKNMGGSSANIGRAITIDVSGNVYTTGYFYGTSDFDPGLGNYNLTSSGYMDIFISKLDPSGNFVWARKMGGSSYDAGLSIAVDISGGLYTTGSFKGTIDFDPGAGTFNLTSGGNQDIFISKVDSSGNFMWAENMGGIYHDVGLSIKIDAVGNVYTKGLFNGSCDFDPGSGNSILTSTGSNSIFVSKMSQQSVGITESSHKDNFTVYPNPSSGIFTVEFQNTTVAAEICVYDVLGNCLWRKNYKNEASPNIDLSTQPKGIYFIEAMFGDKRIIEKLVLQ